MVGVKRCGFGCGFRVSFEKGPLNSYVWVRVEIGELEDALIGLGLGRNRVY